MQQDEGDANGVPNAIDLPNEEDVLPNGQEIGNAPVNGIAPGLQNAIAPVIDLEDGVQNGLHLNNHLPNVNLPNGVQAAQENGNAHVNAIAPALQNAIANLDNEVQNGIYINHHLPNANFQIENGDVGVEAAGQEDEDVELQNLVQEIEHLAYGHLEPQDAEGVGAEVGSDVELQLLVQEIEELAYGNLEQDDAVELGGDVLILNLDDAVDVADLWLDEEVAAEDFVPAHHANGGQDANVFPPLAPDFFDGIDDHFQGNDED